MQASCKFRLPSLSSLSLSPFLILSFLFHKHAHIYSTHTSICDPRPRPHSPGEDGPHGPKTSLGPGPKVLPAEEEERVHLPHPGSLLWCGSGCLGPCRPAPCGVVSGPLVATSGASGAGTKEIIPPLGRGDRDLLARIVYLSPPLSLPLSLVLCLRLSPVLSLSLRYETPALPKVWKSEEAPETVQKTNLTGCSSFSRWQEDTCLEG